MSLRNPNLSIIAAVMGCIWWRKLVPLWVVFCFFLLVIATAFDFDILIFATSSKYGDLGVILAFGVTFRAVVLLGSFLSGGDVVGRWPNFPLDMMSFQLDVFPPDSVITRLPAALTASIANNQYCWLSMSPRYRNILPNKLKWRGAIVHKQP